MAKSITDKIEIAYNTTLGKSKLKNNKVLLRLNENDYTALIKSVSTTFGLGNVFTPKQITLDDIDYTIVIDNNVNNIEIYQLMTKL